MMNKIMKKVLCVILMILALILGYQYISNRKTKEVNKIERNDDVVRLDFKDISTSSTPETVYEEQKQGNNVQKETLSGNRYFDAMEAYKDILAEYELAQKTEGGIVEMSRAWNTYYYQYQKDSGKLCFLDHFDITAEIQNNKVVSRTYYRVMQDDNRNEELSETEYWKYIKQYTSNPVELEWMLVQGFCEL